MKPYPNNKNYYVTENGLVWSTKSERWLVPSKDSSGYLMLKLYSGSKKTAVIKRVHAMVLETHSSPRPKGMVCRHLNGVKENNHIINLCWGTRQENNDDAKKHHKEGKIFSSAKLSAGDVRTIRDLYLMGKPLKEIYNMYDVTCRTIRNVVSRKTWKWLN